MDSQILWRWDHNIKRESGGKIACFWATLIRDLEVLPKGAFELDFSFTGGKSVHALSKRITNNRDFLNSPVMVIDIREADSYSSGKIHLRGLAQVAIMSFMWSSHRDFREREIFIITESEENQKSVFDHLCSSIKDISEISRFSVFCVSSLEEDLGDIEYKRRESRTWCEKIFLDREKTSISSCANKDEEEKSGKEITRDLKLVYDEERKLA